MKIAILGSGHIAKNLIERFNNTNDTLYYFSRSRQNIDQFIYGQYDVVINCIGVGTPAKLKEIGSEIFWVTEYFDNMVLDSLKGMYINFSSGIVHGSAFGAKSNYRVAKMYSEAKHRSYDLRIVDIRVFAFFSKYIDFKSGYFITEMLKCLKNGTEFLTSETDFIRDYIDPDDLFNLVNICMKLEHFNDGIDAYSLRPVTKFEILNKFAEYGLKYRIVQDTPEMKSGTQDDYFSINHKAELLGYKPKYCALDSLVKTAKEAWI
jgi:hypothetical protein